VPTGQASGTLRITFEFDSGPLRGILRAEQDVQIIAEKN